MTDRIDTLSSLLHEVQETELGDDTAFKTMLCRFMDELNLLDSHVAEGLLVSRPTVNRWRNGMNLPRRATRAVVHSYALKQIKDSLSAAKKHALRAEAAARAEATARDRAAAVARRTHSASGSRSAVTA